MTEPLPESTEQVSLFLTDEELRPYAPRNLRWERDNPLEAYRISLVERLEYLHPDVRVQLTLDLTPAGWPSHLRTKEQVRAGVKQRSGTPWHNSDSRTLLYLRIIYDIPNEYMATVFFQGRTAQDCEHQFSRLLWWMDQAEDKDRDEGSLGYRQLPSGKPWTEKEIQVLAQAMKENREWPDVMALLPERRLVEAKVAWYRYTYRQARMQKGAAKTVTNMARASAELSESQQGSQESDHSADLDTVATVADWLRNQASVGSISPAYSQEYEPPPGTATSAADTAIAKRQSEDRSPSPQHQKHDTSLSDRNATLERKISQDPPNQAEGEVEPQRSKPKTTSLDEDQPFSTPRSPSTPNQFARAPKSSRKQKAQAHDGTYPAAGRWAQADKDLVFALAQSGLTRPEIQQY